MNFYMINPRQGFAGYSASATDGEIVEPRIIPPYRAKERILVEYLGNPPRKPGKRGDFHGSAHGRFVNARALALFMAATRGRCVVNPAVLGDREDEDFQQIWVVNFVDCLDEARTIASPPGGHYKGKIGVIKRPIFDETKWDGSELFMVPQDPTPTLFCSDDFLSNWKMSKLRGITFSRFLMDPEAINC